MPGPFDHPQRAAFAAHSWLIPRPLSRFKDPPVDRQGHTGWTTRSAGRVRNGRFLAQGRRSASSLRTPRGLTTPARIRSIPLCGDVDAAGIRMPLHRFAGTIRRNKHRDDRAHGRLQNPLAQNDVRAAELSRRWEARWNKWKGQPAFGRSWPPTLNPPRIGQTEFQDPSSNCLIRDVETTLGKQVLNVPIAQRETAIEPDGMLDDDRWKAVTTVGYLAHPETLKHRPCRSHAVNVTMPLPMLGALLGPCQVDTMGRRAHLAPVFAPSAVNFGMRRSRSRIRRSGNAAAAIRFIRLWPNACADLPELGD